MGSSSRTRLSTCLVFLFALAVAPALQAQTVFDQNGFGGTHDAYTVLPYEYVDPLSGNLTLVVTDLSLPGNAGLNLTVQRVYNSAVYPNYNNGGDKTLEEDSWAGIGWRLHFGRVLHEDQNGAGATQIEMSDGSRHPLYHTTARPEGWITKEFWVYDKVTHTLKTPNGLVYTFGRSVFLNPTLGTVRYITDIHDAFGNTITFTYFDSTGPPDGVALIHQDLGQGQTRDVTFTYDPTFKALATMTYNGMTWTYTQTAFGPSGYSALRAVQPPIGLAWGYDYEATSGFVGLGQMRVPGGGVINYTYGDADRVAGSTTQHTRVVTQRTIGGDRITPGTWTFQYDQGPNKDTSIVSCPCGTTTYRFNGEGLSGPFEAWRAGTLAEQTISDASGQLERRVQTWMRSDVISPDAVPGTNGVWNDPAVYNPLLVSTVVTRGTHSWTTGYDYHPADAAINDYGRPWRITQTGDLTRTITRQFWYTGFTPYLLDRISRQDITIGSETATFTRVHDANGFLTQQTALGVSTSFEPTAQGNIGAVVDAKGNRTTLHYSWGVQSDTITPLVTSSRAIDPSGLTLSEQVGTTSSALTTHWVYDAGMRIKHVQPPNANSIDYEYDDLQQGWVRIGRGPTSQTSFQLDGFGRVVSTSNRVNLQTRTERDACGRATFQYSPYTTGSGSRGVATQYDALNRVTQVTAADGTSVTRYAYDGVSVTITDAEGRVTIHHLDVFGDPSDARLTSVQDPTTQVTHYTYDVLGHLTRVSGPGAVPDRVWAYNSHGWLDHETQPESGTKSYLYDAVGNLTQVTDANSTVVQYGYDANNRLTSRSNALDATANLTVTYDDLGRLSTQQGPVVFSTFTYDTAGRLARRENTLFSWHTESSYAYDGNGNLTQLTYPDARVVTYNYGPENRLQSIQQNGMTFADGFTYDDSGRPASYLTGAVTHAVTYDSRDRVSHVTSGITSGTPVLDLTYHYSAASRVMSIDDPRPNMSQSFGYDALDRLTSANGAYGALAWSYDAAGNRLSETRAGATTMYAYDPATKRLSATSGASNETFSYDAIGQTTGDHFGTYAYAPLGLLRAVTGPSGSNLSTTYLYDTDNLRTIRRVTTGDTNLDTYSLRGADGKVLEEVVSGCGTANWTRDLIYAGGRLIGAVKNNLDQPRVYFDRATWAVPENAGTAALTVWVVTPSGAPLSCPVTVSYETPAGAPAGTARPGTNYVATNGTLTFPAGTASGTYLRFNVPLMQDGANTPDLTFTSALTNVLGGKIVEPSTITVTLQNVDPPPAINISDISVGEGVGQATFTVSLQNAIGQPTTSGYPVQVSYATQDGTAHSYGAYNDFVAASGTVTIPAGAVSATIPITIIDDTWAEPTETFRIALSSPVNATLFRLSAGAQIVDNERARAPINTALPGNYFADGTALAGYDDYIIVGNRHNVDVTARLTFTRNDGSGTTRDVVVPATGRIVLHVAEEPGLGAEDVSMAVQSTDPAHPLDADHSVYWGPGWQSGRSTEGVSPSRTWYFAEGSIGYFEEYISIFNPTTDAQDVAMAFYGPFGPISSHNVHIEPGPGRTKIRVRDLIGTTDHGTQIMCDVPIVVERTMTWQLGADEREGHSSPGSPTGSTTWYFAEGDTGFSTFLALLNVDGTPATAHVEYLHANGTAYAQDVSIPGQTRVTVAPPAWLPLGSFGYRITSLGGQSLVAERSMYGGPNWTLGTSGVGTPVLSTTWLFQEGNTGSFWDTYFLIANPSSVATNVALYFYRPDGMMIFDTETLAPNQRKTVFVDNVPGMASTGFRTEVYSDAPIVAERVTYWPGDGSAFSLAASLTGSDKPATTGVRSAEPTLGFNPYLTRPPHIGSPPAMYHTVTQGEPGGDRERALAAQAPATTNATDSGSAGATTNDVTSSGSWYGSHVTGGRRP